MTQTMLEIEGLNAYYGRAHILHGVGFSMGRGEVLALMGRNGAGKSTTMKAVMGLVPPQAGRITFEGHTIVGREPFEIARLGIGYVPEERRVFSELSVMENLSVAQRPKREGAPHWTPASSCIFPSRWMRTRSSPRSRRSVGCTPAEPLPEPPTPSPS